MMPRMLASPTRTLLGGLAITLIAVGVFSWYALERIEGLRRLQTETIDRNRRDSLQLLRIQNDLHSLGISLRDMIEGSEPYPLTAWQSQFDRIRNDLADAVRQEASLAPAERSESQQQLLQHSIKQFWDSIANVFELAAAGSEDDARKQIRSAAEPYLSNVDALVARLLVRNNEVDQQVSAQIEEIYGGVERGIYRFVGLVLLAVTATGIYMIVVNRRLFARLERLSDQRSVLARKLIRVQEEVLRSVSRELHDEFGQLLTAIGTMLGRAARQPEAVALRADIEEVREVAQQALESVRGLSQALSPSILDDQPLEQALAWQIEQMRKRSGLEIRYETSGSGPSVEGPAAVHIYRILQEALNNVIRHSQSPGASVRLERNPDWMRLEIEDSGVGLPSAPTQGLGLIAMRERSQILGGVLEVSPREGGGTRVVLRVPLPVEVAA